MSRLDARVCTSVLCDRRGACLSFLFPNQHSRKVTVKKGVLSEEQVRAHRTDISICLQEQVFGRPACGVPAFQIYKEGKREARGLRLAWATQ